MKKEPFVNNTLPFSVTFLQIFMPLTFVPYTVKSMQFQLVYHDTLNLTSPNLGHILLLNGRCNQCSDGNFMFPKRKSISLDGCTVRCSSPDHASKDCDAMESRGRKRTFHTNQVLYNRYNIPNRSDNCYNNRNNNNNNRNNRDRSRSEERRVGKEC